MGQDLIWLDCFWFFDEEMYKAVFNLEDQTSFWVSPWQNIRSNHKRSLGNLKDKRDWEMSFVHILLWTQFHTHQFDAAKLLKKIFVGVWYSNFQWSGQVKFAKNSCSASTMMVPCGSLNSLNWLLYQSLFWPLLLCKMKTNLVFCMIFVYIMYSFYTFFW